MQNPNLFSYNQLVNICRMLLYFIEQFQTQKEYYCIEDELCGTASNADMRIVSHPSCTLIDVSQTSFHF
jgi:hypothetical protein